MKVNPMESGGFDGFPREFQDFLLSLRHINTTERLEENKIRYKALITEPLTRLFYGLAPVAASVDAALETKPSKCLSSMYSDMRFSRGAPLKEYMYVRFREPSREKDIPGLYFDMGCEYYSYGIRIYNQTGPGMERIRKAALAGGAAFARELERAGGLGMAVFGAKYAKDRFAGVENLILRDFLNMRSFRVGKDCPVSDGVFRPELLEEIAEGFRGAKGLFGLIKDALRGGGPDV
ncbi:MAG: DUF2461 domain-containing protein [Firmicutes bacterium]|nr:DUF2461 domain-containing protein [Bacillota bacterium]